MSTGIIVFLVIVGVVAFYVLYCLIVTKDVPKKPKCPVCRTTMTPFYNPNSHTAKHYWYCSTCKTVHYKKQ